MSMFESSGGGPPDPPEGRSNKKLDYARVSIACSRCRRRKMRCVPSGDEPGGPCRNCLLRERPNECVYEPVDHVGSTGGRATASEQSESVESPSTRNTPIAPPAHQNVFASTINTITPQVTETYNHSPEPFTGRQPVIAFPGGTHLPTAPVHTFGPAQLGFPYRNIPNRASTEGNFSMDTMAYTGFDHAVPGTHGQHLPSSYPIQPHQVQSSYITSTADDWREQVPLHNQGDFEPGPFIYSPPEEYNPFGVPRRAVTSPYLVTSNVMMTGPGGNYIHPTHGQPHLPFTTEPDVRIPSADVHSHTSVPQPRQHQATPPTRRSEPTPRRRPR